MEKKEIGWYIVIAAIFIFLVVTNYRQIQINKRLVSLDDKINGLAEYHYKLINENSNSLSVFEQRVRSNIMMILSTMQRDFLDKLNETKISSEFNSATEACGFSAIDELDTYELFSGDRVIGKLNSSMGVIFINIKNDSTISCQEHRFFSNETRCEELCQTKNDTLKAAKVSFSGE